MHIHVAGENKPVFKRKNECMHVGTAKNSHKDNFQCRTDRKLRLTTLLIKNSFSWSEAAQNQHSACNAQIEARTKFENKLQLLKF